MVFEIVDIDTRLDQLQFESPAEAIKLILQEYQNRNSPETFVAASAAKLVLKSVTSLLTAKSGVDP